MKKRTFCMLILTLVLISLFAIGASADEGGPYADPISLEFSPPGSGSVLMDNPEAYFTLQNPNSGIELKRVFFSSSSKNNEDIIEGNLEENRTYLCSLLLYYESDFFCSNGEPYSSVLLNKGRIECSKKLLACELKGKAKDVLSPEYCFGESQFLLVQFSFLVSSSGGASEDPGEQENPEGPAIPEIDRFKEVNISIAEDLAMTFYYTPEENEPYTDYRTQATLQLAGGETVFAELRPWETEDGKKAFTFTGIAPQCMCDELTQILQGKKEDGTWEDIAQMSCSVRDYCIKLLEGNTSNEPLKKLIYDLLAYGSAAQSYQSYNTGNPADAGYSQEGLRTVFPADEVKNIVADQTNYGNGQDGKRFHGAKLLLNNVNYICFSLEISNPENAKNLWVFLDYGGENNSDTISFEQLEKGEDGIFHCYSRPMSLCSSGDSVDASLYDGQTKLQTVSYSVNHYIARKYESADSNLQDLLQRLYCLGESAKAYGNSN